MTGKSHDCIMRTFAHTMSDSLNNLNGIAFLSCSSIKKLDTIMSRAQFNSDDLSSDGDISISVSGGDTLESNIGVLCSKKKKDT